MIRGQKEFLILVTITAICIGGILFVLFTTPEKTQMLGPTTPQKCPSNQVWDSNYFGGNRGGSCRHVNFVVIDYKMSNMTNTTLSKIIGHVIQIQKHNGDGYTITLASGKSYDMLKISSDINLNSVISIDEVGHEYKECIINAIEAENQTWYYGKNANDIIEKGILYWNGGIDNKQECENNKFVDYKESEK